MIHIAPGRHKPTRRRGFRTSRSSPRRSAERQPRKATPETACPRSFPLRTRAAGALASRCSTTSHPRRRRILSTSDPRSRTPASPSDAAPRCGRSRGAFSVSTGPRIARAPHPRSVRSFAWSAPRPGARRPRNRRRRLTLLRRLCESQSPCRTGVRVRARRHPRRGAGSLLGRAGDTVAGERAPGRSSDRTPTDTRVRAGSASAPIPCRREIG